MSILSDALDGVKEHGLKGLIVHNDAQHFSAGVNLERFLDLIIAGNWSGIDGFLIQFQTAMSALLYCRAPVVGAPSGLAIGGGFEVLAHCDRVIAHANSILGFVEASVGLVPGGGGVKETYWRWHQRLGDWEKAAWNTFNQIGNSQTGSSPQLAAKLCYYLPDRDSQVMNRDRLIGVGRSALSDMQNGYKARKTPEFVLAGGDLYSQMVEFLIKGKDKGWFYPYDVTVASAIAAIVTGGENSLKRQVSEQEMFDYERQNFIRLAKTPQTRERIVSMLDGGKIIRN